MRTTIGLRNVVGIAEYLFGVGIVPLHRYFNADQPCFACGVKHIGMQHRLGTIDVLDKTFDTPGKGKVLFLVVALIDQLDLHTIIQEGKFAQTFGENVVMEFNRAENLFIRKKMYFGAATFRFTDDSEG